MEKIAEALQITLAFVAGLFGMLASELSYAALSAQFLDPQQTVLFVGDMMFDRSIRAAMDDHGTDHVFSCMKSALAEADVVVGNLEGPITSSSSRSLGSKIGSPNNFIFTFPLAVAPALAKHNIGIVTLGNNHTLNFGFDGVRQTRRALADAGVGYFGDPIDHTVHERDTAGVPLSFIAYNEFGGTLAASTTIAQIKEARTQGRIPIVFAHWGDEYAAARPRQVALARRFIDAGAELVIGAHPHVVQAHEVYAGKHIYYSLGNFIFDQYWNDAVRRGMVVSVVFDRDGVVSVAESYTRLERDRRTCPAV